MQTINQMKLEFLSVPENEGFARVAVSAFAVQLNPTLDVLADIKTAVSEAVTNAVVHAYPDREGSVTVTVTVYDTNVVKIRVRDKGVGIEDVQKAREALFTTAGDDRSGLGFTVMESFSDKLQVRSKPGKGTAVTITKRITGKRAG